MEQRLGFLKNLVQLRSIRFIAIPVIINVLHEFTFDKFFNGNRYSIQHRIEHFSIPETVTKLGWHSCRKSLCNVSGNRMHLNLLPCVIFHCHVQYLGNCPQRFLLVLFYDPLNSVWLISLGICWRILSVEGVTESPTWKLFFFNFDSDGAAFQPSALGHIKLLEVQQHLLFRFDEFSCSEEVTEWNRFGDKCLVFQRICTTLTLRRRCWFWCCRSFSFHTNYITWR